MYRYIYQGLESTNNDEKRKRGIRIYLVPPVKRLFHIMKVRNNRTPQESLATHATQFMRLLYDVYKISHRQIKSDDTTLRLPIS